MKNAFLLSASILSADFTCLGEQLQTVEAAGVDWIHIDVMDGQFVPNLTMGPFIVEACRRVTSLPLDVHLMINTPERLLEDFVRAGADWLSIHAESGPNLHRTLQRIRQLGCKAGVVLNPGTPASWIEPVAHLVDLVLVMSVNPGYSGQSFLPETLPKVTEVRRILAAANSTAFVQIDGGISAQTLPAAAHAGAQVFVAATAIFKHPQGISAGVQALRSSLTP